MEQPQHNQRREKEVTGTTCFSWMDSPLGRLLLAGDGRALTLINFQAGNGAMVPRPDWTERAEPFREAVRQLDGYFAGRLSDFDLPLAPRGTAFQQKVWGALREIPYGQTRTYGQLAQGLGMPGAARAVGAANGRNPLPVVVPCHRVIGGDGSLTGFYGGLSLKQALLDLEGWTRPGAQLSLL